MIDKDLSLIKKRYFRVANVEASSISGFALGLNMASKLALLTSSVLTIESKQGKGTKVILKILLE